MFSSSVSSLEEIQPVTTGSLFLEAGRSSIQGAQAGGLDAGDCVSPRGAPRTSRYLPSVVWQNAPWPSWDAIVV